MDAPTQDPLVTLRNLLTSRQIALRADVRAAEQLRQDEGPRLVADVQDQKEVAARWQSNGLQDSQQRRDRQELDQVDAALHRLDLGHYGDCQDCAEPIPLQRLLAQPAALRCAECQSDFEQHRERGAARGTA